MQIRTIDQWEDSLNQHQLQNKFWASINDIKYSKEIRKQLNINISSTFLERNSFLI